MERNGKEVGLLGSLVRLKCPMCTFTCTGVHGGVVALSALALALVLDPCRLLVLAAEVGSEHDLIATGAGKHG